MKSFIISLFLFALLSAAMGYLVARSRRRNGQGPCGPGVCRCDRREGESQASCRNDQAPKE